MTSHPAGHALPAAPLPGSFVARLVPAAASTPAPDEHQGVLPWDEPECAPPPAIRALPADPGAWASRFVQATVEVLSGHRPVAQLVGWTAPTVFRDLERRARATARAVPRGAAHAALRPRVGSVHVCRLGPDVAEVCVRVRHGRRSRAVAMRLEATQGRWRCTAIELG